MMRITRLTLPGLAVAAFVALASAVHAAGPVETSVYAMQGVAIDVTDTDAATAKQKALVDVQVLAFRQLADKQNSTRLSEDIAKLESKDIMPYLKSLSVEEESVAPGRYAGKFTVRFLPDKVRALYEKYGITLPDDQGPPLVIIPVWTENGVNKLWEDNPWRQAWLNLRAEQSTVPIIVALGDAPDQKALSAADIAAKDEVKLEAIRRRYDVKSVLIASASPSAVGPGVSVKIEGDSPIGRVRIEKTYGLDAPSLEEASNQAVSRFQALMTDKYRRDTEKIAAAKAQEQANRKPSAIPVAVPFSSPSQWNGLRARILATPGVVGVDVSSLDAEGAVIQLLFRGPVDNLVDSFSSAGLAFSRIGETWIIQPG
jgi:hypothetical protein